MSAPSSPAVAWARERSKRRGVSWETLEAHLFTAHPQVQLLLRVRGRVLPNKGAWFRAAWVVVLAAILPVLWFGPSRPVLGWAVAGIMLLAAAACELIGWVRALRGYGTDADAVWGGAVMVTSLVPLSGMWILEGRIGDGMAEGPSVLFWASLAALAFSFLGLACPTLSPSKMSARYYRALETVAALPEPERERIRGELAAALDVLVERGLVRASTRRYSLATPLGGLTASHRNRSPN